jgi:predicted phosphodiesterase
MRYAIFADIHANLTAFKAVLDDIEKRGGFKEIWCLGDIVGYGPEPHKCLELLKKHHFKYVVGNHDWAVSGRIDMYDFNTDAAVACEWTMEQLGKNEIEFLEEQTEVIEQGDFTLVHGSPLAPVWEYLVSEQVAVDNFSTLNTHICLVGHSHIPVIFKQNDDNSVTKIDFEENKVFEFSGGKYFFNPGSIGQPRNMDPRASYAVVDDDAMTIERFCVDYDIEATQHSMEEAGLPDFLVYRLKYGI